MRCGAQVYSTELSSILGGAARSCTTKVCGVTSRRDLSKSPLREAAVAAPRKSHCCIVSGRNESASSTRLSAVRMAGALRFRFVRSTRLDSTTAATACNAALEKHRRCPEADGMQLNRIESNRTKSNQMKRERSGADGNEWRAGGRGSEGRSAQRHSLTQSLTHSQQRTPKHSASACASDATGECSSEESSVLLLHYSHSQSTKHKAHSRKRSDLDETRTSLS